MFDERFVLRRRKPDTVIARFRIGVLPGQPPTQSSRLAATTGATESEAGSHTVLGENNSLVADWRSSRAGKIRLDPFRSCPVASHKSAIRTLLGLGSRL